MEQHPPPPKTAKEKMADFFRSYGTSLLSVVLFAVALWALYHGLAEVHLRDVAAEIRAQTWSRLGGALGLTFGSYFLLTLYDFIGLHYLDRRLPYPKVALASFVGYAVSNSVGHSLLVGAPIRYRLYANSGLSALDVGKLLVYSTTMIWVGFIGVSGLLFTIEPLRLPSSLSFLPFASTVPIGVVFLLMTAGFVLFSFLGRKAIRFRRWEIEVPRPRLVIPQLLAAGADWVLAGTVLFLMLPQAIDARWLVFVSIFLLAQLVGYASQVPGGLGIFESTILLLMAPPNPAPLVGALVLYRLVYYVLPLTIGVALLLVREIADRREKLSRFGQTFRRLLPEMAPPAFAIGALVAGTVLLFSGALPMQSDRLELLRGRIPLPLVEVAHFCGSLAGVGLLLLAPGLDRRLEAAWRWTSVLLGIGVAASLFQGFDFEEAILLALLLVTLLPARRHFGRSLALRDLPFSPAWVGVIGVVLAGSVWLGGFAYKKVVYSRDLWWQFSLNGDASRFLRATIGALVVLLTFSLVHLLTGADPPPEDGED